jgi:hypothetical protein
MCESIRDFGRIGTATMKSETADNLYVDKGDVNEKFITGICRTAWRSSV